MALSKIAVIGDVHSNVLALRSTLRSIAQYEANFSPCDLIIFVGDLLTYGVRPYETLSEVHQLSTSRRLILLLGNHDQMYRNLIRNSSSDYYQRLPDWIKESVGFNLSYMDQEIFLDLSFSNFFVYSDIIFSHANLSPFAFDLLDWSYVNTAEDHQKQFNILSRSGCGFAVFGHTHRARCYSMSCAQPVYDPTDCINRNIILDRRLHFGDYSLSILNAGSIGQQREKSAVLPSWLLIETDNCMVQSATFVSFEYDVDAHLRDLRESSLSSSCIQKLSSFF